MSMFSQSRSTAGPRTAVLIDDHAILRAGLRRILEEHRYTIEGEAGNAVEARDVLARCTPAFVILDISLPGVRGIELAGEILADRPATQIIFLTVHRDEEYVYQALSIGASGYVLKDCIDTELIGALQAVAEGKKYITPLVSNSVFRSFSRSFRKTPFRAAYETLTTREREVLTLICNGKATREIGELLCISTRTAEHHRQAGMKKLGVHSLAELIKVAIRNKLVDL